MARSLVSDIERGHFGSTPLYRVRAIAAALDIRIDLIGTLDRKARLGSTIAADRGRQARSVSRWVIVSRDKTNQRRIEAHRSMLRAAFPSNGHAVRGWLAEPTGPISALSMWSAVVPTDASPTRSQRVRVSGPLGARR